VLRRRQVRGVGRDLTISVLDKVVQEEECGEEGMEDGDGEGIPSITVEKAVDGMKMENLGLGGWEFGEC
jgi:hypothetical protein